MECEYAKYGCDFKPTSNTEHLKLHVQCLAHEHLKHVVQQLEKEAEKNKRLAATVEALQSRLVQVEKSKGEVLDTKVKELEGKLQLLQGLFEKNPYLEVKHNGSAIPIDDPQVKAVPQKQGEIFRPPSRSTLDPRFGGQSKSTLERAQEEKAKEEKAKEEKAKEEKLKEEKAKEERAKKKNRK